MMCFYLIMFFYFLVISLVVTYMGTIAGLFWRCISGSNLYCSLSRYLGFCVEGVKFGLSGVKASKVQ